MKINLKDYPELLDSVLNSLDDGVLIYGKRIIDTIINESAKHFLSNCVVEIENKKIKILKNMGEDSELLLYSNLDKVTQLFKNYPSGNQILNMVQAKDEDGNNISFYRKIISGADSSKAYNIILIKYNISKIKHAKAVTNILNLLGDDDITISKKNKDDDVITIVVKQKSLNKQQSKQ